MKTIFFFLLWMSAALNAAPDAAAKPSVPSPKAAAGLSTKDLPLADAPQFYTTRFMSEDPLVVFKKYDFSKLTGAGILSVGNFSDVRVDEERKAIAVSATDKVWEKAVATGGKFNLTLSFSDGTSFLGAVFFQRVYLIPSEAQKPVMTEITGATYCGNNTTGEAMPYKKLLVWKRNGVMVQVYDFLTACAATGGKLTITYK